MGWLDRLATAAVFGMCLLAPPATAAPAPAPGDVVESFDGRDMIIHIPTRLPASGPRAMIVVLHGGLGNAERIASAQSESAMNMDAEADQFGFVVAYLNGTPVTRLPGARMFGWNAGGGCCGQSAAREVDDLAYIKGAVNHLAGEYGLDRGRVFAIGHSNGAMMAQRMMCETDVFAAAVALSGPLNLDIDRCPDAAGRRILAIHGAEDENVPLGGGRGTKGLSGVVFHSEDSAKHIFEKSGAIYTLQIVAGADHQLGHIDEAVRRAEGVSISQKATQFFGLK